MRLFPLRSEHAEGVAALIRDAFADQGQATDPPSSALRETAEVVVAKLAAGGGAGIEFDGRLVAALLWAPEDDALYCGRLAVAAAQRGQGLAARLLAMAAEEARRRGLAKLRVQVRLELARNRALFAREGFVEVGRKSHPGYDRPTIGVMEKALV